MDVAQLSALLSGVPHMTPEQGEAITEFIQTHNLRRCLELGFAHGVGTCYLANAVQGSDGGHVVAIDLEAARKRTPNIETTMRRAGLDPAGVEIYFEPLSYNWRLMAFLEEGRAGSFDFVYLDGAHAWEPDGLAFFLSARLLRPGGWILFDDLNWTMDHSPALQAAGGLEGLPEEVRQTPQVRKIWELLVKTHQDFDRLIEQDDWAIARKRLDSPGEKVIVRYHPLAATLLEFKNLVRKARHRRQQPN